MVRFHVVYHQIVYFLVANHLADVLNVLGEKVHFHSINETHLIVIDKIRVIAHTIGQRPQALEKGLVTVVHTYVVDFVFNFFHCYISL